MAVNDVNTSWNLINERNLTNLTEVDQSEIDDLSHKDLKTLFHDTLESVLSCDPVLSDINPKITVNEIEALLELEHGRAMIIFIEKQDGEAWKVVVPRNCSVNQLKVALKHHVALALTRQGVKKKMSWKYIWRTYWLSFEGNILCDENAKLLDLGIRNKSRLSFAKRLSERVSLKKRRNKL